MENAVETSACLNVQPQKVSLLNRFSVHALTHKMTTQLGGLTVELECQVKLAEQYKASLDTVQQLHCKCQEEVGRMRTQLVAKETDLSRALTALQLTSSQVSGHTLSCDPHMTSVCVTRFQHFNGEVVGGVPNQHPLELCPWR